MQITKLILFFYLALAGPGFLFAQKKNEDSFLKVLNVRYATHTKHDPKLNMLNVYMPKKGSNSPMVVWLHGGSLAFGDKDKVLSKAEYFTARGYVFVSVNYRQPPEVRHPVSAQDVADAIAWLHQNSTHYSADPEKMFVIGHSAGAQLAALITLDAKYLKNAGANPSLIDGVVLLDGTGYDLPLLMKQADTKTKEWFTRAFGKTKKDWDQASAVNFVKTAGTTPFMIAYADEETESGKQAILLAKKLSEADVNNKVFHYPRKTTASINKELGRETDKTTEDVYRFLQEIHYTAVNPIR